MSELTQRKLNIIIDRYSLTSEDLTVSNMMNRAIMAEEKCKSSEPGSLLYAINWAKYIDFQNAALYLEKLIPLKRKNTDAV